MQNKIFPIFPILPLRKNSPVWRRGKLKGSEEKRGRGFMCIEENFQCENPTNSFAPDLTPAAQARLKMREIEKKSSQYFIIFFPNNIAEK